MHQRIIRKLSILLCIFIVSGTSACSPEKKEMENTQQAWNVLTAAVEQKIDSTGEVTFPENGLQNVTRLGDNSFQVTSYVDFKNHDGESQRSYFYGTVTLNGSVWTVESIKFSQ